MKINRSSSFAKSNMRKKGATSDRPEQMLLAEILRFHVLGITETEVKLKNLKNIDALNFTEERAPCIDIVLRMNDFPTYLIRVNGASHDTDKRAKYDRAQKLFLEMQDTNYKVIDVSYVRHELLFERNKRKLTVHELYKVLDLLHSEFLVHGITFNPMCTTTWIERTEHKISE